MPNWWDDFQSETENIRQKTLKEHAVRHALFLRGLDLYVKAFQVSPAVDKGSAQQVQMGFLSQAFNSLWSAYQLTLTGNYFQVGGLLRFVQESWNAFWYLQNNPTEAFRWLDDSPTVHPPSGRTMLNKMAHPSPDAKKDADDIRQGLSKHVHADPIALSNLYDYTSVIAGIHYGFRYDASLADACMLDVLRWLGLMLDAMKVFNMDVVFWLKQVAEFNDSVSTILVEDELVEGVVPEKRDSLFLYSQKQKGRIVKGEP